jgi:2-polyprenyl-6-methoxyphenol hydroxylase-like FAD-dependent oxidoreductase
MLTNISFKELDTKYPFAVRCPKNRTEAVSLRRLQSLGGAVQRLCDIVTVRPAEDDVELQFESGEELKTVRTKWLVGCDGMHRVVREQASIPFIGGNYEESFVLADMEMDWPLDREKRSLFLSDKGLVSWLRCPAINSKSPRR